MANVIKTVMTYSLNGSTVDFNIPFEYLARKFVTITLIGTDRKVLVLNQDFRFSTKTTITTNKAWGPSDGYDTLEVRRYTSATDRLVDFADGSILRAYDLNISQVQTLHVAEEARDLTADTIGVNNDGNLDARGRRIVNVADAQGDFDAVNLRQILTWNNGAYQSAQKAKVSENNAKASENNAKASENNAKASENNANSARDLARDWASKDENQVVADGKYSSYHYSRKAANSASAASTSEGNAKTSENNAKNSENNAKNSENNAKNSENSAKTEAAKLGNMNAFAAAIQAVNGTTVDMKGTFGSPDLWANGSLTVQGHETINLQATSDWLTIKQRYAVGDNYQSNGLRIKNGDSFTMDLFHWEATGNHTEAVMHVYESSGKGNYLRLRASGELQTDGALRSNGAYIDGGWFNMGNTSLNNGDGWLDVRIDGNRRFSVNRTDIICDNRLYANGGVKTGGITLANGSNAEGTIASDGNIWGTQWNGGDWLGSYLKNVYLTDMWLGGQEWWQTNWNQRRDDWALGGGHVCTGYTQDVLSGPHIYIAGMFNRALWVRVGNGSARIIAST